jgi:membrane-bound metal-dependent hydrolase YbcI (DUF457 family)
VFIGHFAVGFAAKKFAPRASLTALVFAPLFADILWPVLVAVGAERVRIAPGDTAYTPLEFISYPWSHSLLMLIVWGALLGAYFRKREDGARIALVIAALVVSHWILDWVTHRPDMPLYPGGPRYGLGLWNNVMWTMIVEIAMLVAGVSIYASVTRAKDGIGKWAFRALFGFLMGFYVWDSLDPSAPPSVTAIWISALIATAVMLGWMALIERHRETSTS